MIKTIEIFKNSVEELYDKYKDGEKINDGYIDSYCEYMSYLLSDMEDIAINMEKTNEIFHQDNDILISQNYKLKQFKTIIKYSVSEDLILKYKKIYDKYLEDKYLDDEEDIPF